MQFFSHWRLVSGAIILAIPSVGVTSAVSQGAPSVQGASVSAQTKPAIEIRHLVDVYVQSINEADTTLAATVWDPSPEVSFIEPLGQERGWNQIEEEFYRNTMGGMFTKRTLTVSDGVEIHVYGTAAVVEFQWAFVGILHDGGKTIHTSGRESQVYVDFPGKGWRLVHVHYSGPALTQASTGF